MLSARKPYESTTHQEICREQVSPGQGSGPNLGGMLPHGRCGMERAESRILRGPEQCASPGQPGLRKLPGSWSRCRARQAGCPGELSLNQERKPGAIGMCGLAGWRLRGDGIAVYKYIKGVNTREGRELFKLRDNAGTRTNGTNWP